MVRYFFLAFLIVVFSGCGLLRGSSSPASPLLGTWDYSVDAGQDVYTGEMVFTQGDGGIVGVVQPTTGPAMEMQDLVFQESTLTFTIDSPSVGELDANVDVMDGGFSGTLYSSDYGTSLPFTGTRTAQ